MCLIVFAYRLHPYYPFIAAANRDEYYERPTSPAAFWENHPRVLAGRDLKEGGTWLGITRRGKFAAITNYRDPASVKSGAPSRGQLVSDFLTGTDSAASYIKKVTRHGQRYNGFNLLCGDRQDLFVYSNRGKTENLEPGLYGLSNASLNTPWPKVVKAKKILSSVLRQRGDQMESTLFTMLNDRKTAPLNRLPATGVSREWEKRLSAVFIRSPLYGTRSSTVVRIGRNGRVTFVEKSFNGSTDPWLESRISFILNQAPY
ncbi:MAG: NRDE family protein [Thermodesulfobacteriota bacterium]